jgi:outer membrane receptor for ferrienterochelin and colicins
MKHVFLFALLLIFTFHSYCQNTFKAIVRIEKTQEVLTGATVLIPKLKKGASSDSSGFIMIKDIPDGKFEIKCSFLGFEEKKKVVSFPLSKPEQTIEFELEPKGAELGEVVVQTTRSSRTIQNIPTRIEVITGEELDEKATMKPGDIKMLLNESTGIATQQTSAVSGTANIRIQGLDGRYTQLLRDGMPLYQGFSGGLSIMQIAPLDFKQVEFIKGSASTLYGGGAIAGLVNLISKTPQGKRELSFLLNGTTGKGLDGSGFYSQKWKKVGTTIFSSYNFNAPYDPANMGLTAIPQTNRFTINPKIFVYLNEKTTGWFGLNTTYENRYGGDTKVIEGKADNIHQYFERNTTWRASTQLSFTHQINKESKISFKNTVGLFDRKISQPAYDFNGQQVSSFSEINYSNTKEKSEWIAGVNMWTDNFKSLDTSNLHYNLTTVGAFTQNTFKATQWFSLETGLRMDYNTPKTKNKSNGIFLLPRINALLKINQHWTSRIGGGLGYKMPSPFIEEAEKKGYNNIQNISFASTKAEQSYGGNADINYRTSIDEVSISINELFFYTYLNNPVILEGNELVNANGHIDTKGAETNLKIRSGDLHFFLGYTYTDANQHYNGIKTWQPLTSRHRLNSVLMWEAEDKYRIGVEGLYVSEQQLSDGAIGKGYIMFGFLFEKMWKHLNVFINAENFTDRRQTRWDTIYTGTTTNPVFRNIYAPLDGVVVNAGIKITL